MVRPVNLIIASLYNASCVEFCLPCTHDMPKSQHSTQCFSGGPIIFLCLSVGRHLHWMDRLLDGRLHVVFGTLICPCVFVWIKQHVCSPAAVPNSSLQQLWCQKGATPQIRLLSWRGARCRGRKATMSLLWWRPKAASLVLAMNRVNVETLRTIFVCIVSVRLDGLLVGGK